MLRLDGVYRTLISHKLRMIDELAIYNGALTAQDAQAHWEAAFATGGPGSGTPEPSTAVLMGLGLIGLLTRGWRRRRRS